MSKVLLTVDLGFGDSGKGTIVDTLVRQTNAHTVVRFNGGAQAAHRVVAEQQHVFSQFGSGSLAGANTFLSRYMLIEPFSMQAEADALIELGQTNIWQRTSIDQRALVITPFQRAANRLSELARGDQRHGSCGMGIGETMIDSLQGIALRAGDLHDPNRSLPILRQIHQQNLSKVQHLRAQLTSPQALEEWEWLDDPWDDWLPIAYQRFSQLCQITPPNYLASLLQQGSTVFEAAQGVLLDEWRGFHPYTTWSTTTLDNAYDLLREADYTGTPQRIGITRAYCTRHGAGPMPSEDNSLSLPDAANINNPWQHKFRIGWLDLVLLRYALDCVGPLDGLAVTCLDRLAELPALKVCTAYQIGKQQISHLALSPKPQDLAYQSLLTQQLLQAKPILQTLYNSEQLLELIEQISQVPILISSAGPSANNKSTVPQAAWLHW